MYLWILANVFSLAATEIGALIVASCLQDIKDGIPKGIDSRRVLSQILLSLEGARIINWLIRNINWNSSWVVLCLTSYVGTKMWL